jgi:hypothetical protein
MTTLVVWVSVCPVFVVSIIYTGAIKADSIVLFNISRSTYLLHKSLRVAFPPAIASPEETAMEREGDEKSRMERASVRAWLCDRPPHASFPLQHMAGFAVHTQNRGACLLHRTMSLHD